jgi:N-acyl-D-aspartate/D-glutamate deacylase
VIIAGATVFDGTGAPGRKADVAVKDGRIAEVGRLTQATAARRIDAAGMALSPGFIDAHAHSEFGLYINPAGESQVGQGITTEVAGQCGFSPFPLSSRTCRHSFFWPRERRPGWPELDWTDAAGYFRRARSRGMGMNLVPFLGHLSVRAEVVGDDDRPLTPAERGRLLQIVDDALTQGAPGLSSGVAYTPAKAADAAELTDCCRVLSRHGGVYAAHVRSYEAGTLAAVKEAVEVAATAGVPLQVSHLSVAGRANWGQGAAAFEYIAAERRRGRRITADVIPYPTQGLWWGPRIVLPSRLKYDWRQAWGPQARRTQGELQAVDALERLVSELEADPLNEEAAELGLCPGDLWAGLHIVSAGAAGRELVGLSLMDAAARRGVTPGRLWATLLAADGEALGTVLFSTDETDFLAAARDPGTAFCTDSIATSPELVGASFCGIQSHPRHWGTFPRVLGLYVREQGILTLPEAIRKMTALPAAAFGLQGRGVVRAGCWADLVAFDPRRVGERGTYTSAVAYPAGIEVVLVNGRVAYEAGRFTGDLAGRLLTRDELSA